MRVLSSLIAVKKELKSQETGKDYYTNIKEEKKSGKIVDITPHNKSASNFYNENGDTKNKVLLKKSQIQQIN